MEKGGGKKTCKCRESNQDSSVVQLELQSLYRLSYRDSHFLQGKQFLPKNLIAEILSTFCPHSVHIQSTFCSNSVHILSTFCSHSVHILFTFCSHSVHILSTFCPHSVHILFTFCSHSVHIKSHCSKSPLYCIVAIPNS
jgi:hypothetical protein